MRKLIKRSVGIGIIFGIFSQSTAFSGLHWIRLPSAPIALTFDDGPRSGKCGKLLETLKKHDVKATFFVVGKMAAEDPADIRQMALDGHEIANHTWSHPNIQHISRSRLRRELNKTRDLIDSLTGQQTRLFRAPGGTRGFLEKHLWIPKGYRMVLWNVHSGDQMGFSSKEIERRILLNVKAGDIVLMHNGLVSTMNALDHLIPILKARGFTFVTVSELEQERGRNLIAIRESKVARG